MDILQYLLLFSLLLALVYTNFRIAKKEAMPVAYRAHLHLLLGVHFFYAAFFYGVIMTKGGDSLAYWQLDGPLAPENPSSWGDYFGSGYLFMYWLNYPFSSILGWSWLTGSLLYSMLGFIGVRYLFVLIYKYFPQKDPAAWIPWGIMFLYFPGIHFWTGGVGKEALCFWGITGFLYALDNPGKKWEWGVLALVVLTLVRPYLGWLLLFAFGISGLIAHQPKAKRRTIVSGITLALLLILLPVALLFSGFDDFSWSKITDMVQLQQDQLSGDQVLSAVEMSEYSQIMRWWTYWFRPLWWDAHNFLAQIASLENTLYLLATILLLVKFRWKNRRELPFFLTVGFVYFVLTSFIYANSLGNLGIMVRMKSLLMIYFLLFLLFMSRYRTEKPL